MRQLSSTSSVCFSTLHKRRCLQIPSITLVRNWSDVIHVLARAEGSRLHHDSSVAKTSAIIDHSTFIPSPIPQLNPSISKPLFYPHTNSLKAHTTAPSPHPQNKVQPPHTPTSSCPPSEASLLDGAPSSLSKSPSALVFPSQLRGTLARRTVSVCHSWMTR